MMTTQKKNNLICGDLNLDKEKQTATVKKL